VDDDPGRRDQGTTRLPAVAPAPDAPLGGGDPTRRWGLAGPDGVVRFPGVTRLEADEAAAALAGEPPARWPSALVEVALPVLLSDEAGPHMVDVEGRLVLGLGAHPGLTGATVAMGEVGAGVRVGALRRGGRGRVWWWVAWADVGRELRVVALDELAAACDENAVEGWAARWRGGA
jgi:hypothetical protein